MRPDSLLGMIFNIPLFSALEQEYQIIDVRESGLPGHWLLKLEWLPTKYSVPHQIDILVNRVVDNKMMFTMTEINNHSKKTLSLNKKIVNRTECDTIEKLEKIFYKLGEV